MSTRISGGDLRHAVRNSLTAVMGLTELLEERDYPAARRRELLALLRCEVRRLGELLEGSLLATD